MMKRKVDGNELLYHFFQKAWLEAEPEAARSFIKKAIDTLGVWMHPSYYSSLPIVVPYPMLMNGQGQGRGVRRYSRRPQ